MKLIEDYTVEIAGYSVQLNLKENSKNGYNVGYDGLWLGSINRQNPNIKPEEWEAIVYSPQYREPETGFKSVEAALQWIVEMYGAIWFFDNGIKAIEKNAAAACAQSLAQYEYEDTLETVLQRPGVEDAEAAYWLYRKKRMPSPLIEKQHEAGVYI